MMLLLLAAVLAQTATLPAPHTIELLADPGKVVPVAVNLPREERLWLEVKITAPETESAVEDLEIKADNQHPDYWKDRVAPNLLVKVERVLSDGGREPARIRLVSTGGGQSLNVHYRSVAIDILGSQEARLKRVREFVAKNTPGVDGSAASAYLEPMLIANPPGRYEVTIEYKPATGIYAKQPLSRRFMVEVQDGPDTLDRLISPATPRPETP